MKKVTTRITDTTNAYPAFILTRCNFVSSSQQMPIEVRLAKVKLPTPRGWEAASHPGAIMPEGCVMNGHLASKWWLKVPVYRKIDLRRPKHLTSPI